MNGKGDKTRRGVNWKRYRSEHERIFGAKRNSLKALKDISASLSEMEDALKTDEPNRFMNALANMIKMR